MTIEKSLKKIRKTIRPQDRLELMISENGPDSCDPDRNPVIAKVWTHDGLRGWSCRHCVEGDNPALVLEIMAMERVDLSMLKCKHGIRMGGDCKDCSELIKEIREGTLEFVNDLEDDQKRDVSKSTLRFGKEVVENFNMADNEVAVLGSLTDKEREVIKKKMEND